MISVNSNNFFFFSLSINKLIIIIIITKIHECIEKESGPSTTEIRMFAVEGPEWNENVLLSLRIENIKFQKN